MEYVLTDNKRKKLYEVLEKSQENLNSDWLCDMFKSKKIKNLVPLEILNEDDFEFFYRIQNLSIRDMINFVEERYNIKDELDHKKALNCVLGYINNKSVENKSNQYEKWLSSLGGFVSEDSIKEAVLLCLLDKEVDLNYETMDYTGTPTTLETLLCDNQQNKKVIERLLKYDLSLYFYDHYCALYDLCRLSIRGDNLKKAKEAFENLGFSLHFDEVYEDLKRYDSVEIDFEDRHIFDILPSILSHLVSCGNTNEEKVDFLNTVLYSDKYKIFNIGSFEQISKIYSDSEYLDFVDYIIDKAKKDDVILFSGEQSFSNEEPIVKENAENSYVKAMSYKKENK